MRNYSISTGFVVRVQQWLGDLHVAVRGDQQWETSGGVIDAKVDCAISMERIILQLVALS